MRTGVDIASVTPAATPGGPVTVRLSDGSESEFDAVVLGTHSDTSLALLGAAAPPRTAAVLRAIPYSKNDVYLHTDVALMPQVIRLYKALENEIILEQRGLLLLRPRYPPAISTVWKY